jgi:DNA polymerase
VAYAEGMGVIITLDQAVEIVEAYRSAYAKVKNCWYAMGQAGLDAIRNPGVSFQAGKVKLKVARDALWMQLPSGRLICWQRPEIVRELTPWGKAADVIYVTSQNTFTRKWGRNKLIGSSIFQSSVQGTARDFLAESAWSLNDKGVDVINLIHDEILSLARVEDAAEVEKLMMTALTTPPSWAPNFPLAAESWIDTRYRK